jgi:L-alanine-DL-glutamate epimerase-like enolase superfamily enzyme
MRLLHQPLLLELRHPFRIAIGMRTHTNAVLTQIQHEGLVGHGEAAMPPYYGETHDTAAAFLDRAAQLLAPLHDMSDIGAIMAEVDALAPGNHAAKAAVDIALHDLWAKMQGQALWQLWGMNPDTMPPSSFTLGMDSPEVLREKLAEGADFHIIKVKLGSDDDQAIVRNIRQWSDKPIYADANQGWKDRAAALELVAWLATQNVLLIEQPFPKDDLASAAWLRERSPLPLIADESFQRLADLDRVADAFHGVNIKLMKCTGLHEGRQALQAARNCGLQVMIGCMTETSCGISAAAALAPHCDFADLDGCWLIRNNPFANPAFANGRIQLGDLPGLGLVPTAG